VKDITITFLYQRRIGHDQFLSSQFCQRKLIKKIQQQTVNIKNFLMLDDNIEYAQQNKIPLWLFGFLY